MASNKDLKLTDRKRKLLFRYLKERGVYSTFVRGITVRFVNNKVNYQNIIKYATKRELLDLTIRNSDLGGLINSCVLWAATKEGVAFWMRENMALSHFNRQYGFSKDGDEKVDLDVLEESRDVYPIKETDSKAYNHV